MTRFDSFIIVEIIYFSNNMIEIVKQLSDVHFHSSKYKVYNINAYGHALYKIVDQMVFNLLMFPLKCLVK